MSSSPPRRLWRFGLAMALALGSVLGINLFMENREAVAALDAIQQEQGRLATAAAFVAQARLEAQPEPPVHQLLRELGPMQRPGSIRMFLKPPGGSWVDLQGEPAPVAAVALDPAGTCLISRAEARALGLPARMAALGQASFLDATGRPWSVAVAGTALRERDRARNATWRLSMSFLLMGSFLLLLLRWALTLQQQELEYSQEVERRELVRQQDQALAQASRAATVLTLASGVAHEISTPLGVISGRAGQLNARLKEDERASGLVRTILEEVERITRTVRRFLDLARGGTLVSEELDPRSFLTSAAALVAHRFKEAGVTLSVDAPDELPPLRGDARLLEHLLVNILLNACDASPLGSCVNLVARGGGEGLHLEVADQGKGIPEILVERVLEPFFTTKPQGKGTGLGLAIAQEIVRMHKGRLGFEKAQPQGTRVVIWLPVI